MAKTVKSTTLTVGLVTVPVSLKVANPASKANGGVSFKLCNPAGDGAGHPVKQQYIDVVTGEVVERASLESGITVEPDKRVLIVPTEARDAIDAAGSIEGITVDGFLPASEAPFERVQRAYVITPTGKAAAAALKPLAMLRDALVKTNSVGFGKLTLSTKQHPFLMYAKGSALVLNTISFASDCEDIETIGDDLAGVVTDEKTLALAEVLVGNMASDREALDALTDNTREPKAELVQKVLDGEEIPVVTEETLAAPVVDLEAALLASIGQVAEKKAAAKPKRAAKKAA